jgi:hypothetical protein
MAPCKAVIHTAIYKPNDYKMCGSLGDIQSCESPLLQEQLFSYRYRTYSYIVCTYVNAVTLAMDYCVPPIVNGCGTLYYNRNAAFSDVSSFRICAVQRECSSFHGIGFG